jgi:hypothetical protein
MPHSTQSSGRYDLQHQPPAIAPGL